MRIVAILAILTLASCGSNSNNNLESKVKKYITDSVVPTFNDPKSYEYISTVIDTFRVKDWAHNIEYFAKDTILTDSV